MNINLPIIKVIKLKKMESLASLKFREIHRPMYIYILTIQSFRPVILKRNESFE